LPSERGEFHHFENPTGRFGTQIFLLLAIADDWHRKWRRGHRLDDQLDSIRPFCYWSFVLKSCPVRATKAIFSRPPGSEIYHPHSSIWDRDRSSYFSAGKISRVRTGCFGPSGNGCARSARQSWSSTACPESHAPRHSNQPTWHTSPRICMHLHSHIFIMHDQGQSRMHTGITHASLVHAIPEFHHD
jgi:hypothetical protein